MNNKKFGAVSFLFFIVSLALRIVAQMLTLDEKTGFFIEKYKIAGIALCVGSGLFLIFSILILDICIKEKTKPLTPDIFLIVSAVAVGVLSVLDAFCISPGGRFASWQIATVKIVSILNAVFFFAYAITAVARVKLPKYAFAVPLVYSIIKTVRFFALTTSMPVVFENVFSMLFYASLVFFMLEFANVANSVGGVLSVIKLRKFGYLAAELSALCSVPRIITAVLGVTAYYRENIISTLTCFALGIFAFIITFIVFDKKEKSANNT